MAASRDLEPHVLTVASYEHASAKLPPVQPVPHAWEAAIHCNFDPVALLGTDGNAATNAGDSTPLVGTILGGTVKLEQCCAAIECAVLPPMVDLPSPSVV